MACKIKICGITNVADAQIAVEAGVDALGFNFFKGSKRHISAKAAAEICINLPQDVWKVGVFVNASRQEISEVLEQVALDTLQFHGEEDISLLQGWGGRRVIKALRLKQTETPNFQAFATIANYFLLDSAVPGEFGGTGKEIAANLLEAPAISEILPRAFLAGGLNPENVAERLKRWRPFGVDVASGVEESGDTRKKDKKKVAAFVAAVKTADIIL